MDNFLFYRKEKVQKKKIIFFFETPCQEYNIPFRETIRKEYGMDLFDWFINSVRPESLFDSEPFIILLLVSNNGIILS